MKNGNEGRGVLVGRDMKTWTALKTNCRIRYRAFWEKKEW